MGRRSVAFNSHWKDQLPAWDIVLPCGDIVRSVNKRDIQRLCPGRYIDVVREGDIQAYGKVMKARENGRLL